MNTPQMGAPLTYRKAEHYEAIIQAVHDLLVLGQVAGLVGVARTTFQEWITRGDADRANGISSELAHLSAGVRKAQAEEVKILIDKIKRNLKGSFNAKWLLEKCFREDFGADSGIIQELKSQLDRVEAKLLKYMDNPLNGGFRNGGEEVSEESEIG